MTPNDPNKQPDNAYDFILKAEEPKSEPLISRLNKKLLVVILLIFAALSVVALLVLSSFNTQANNAQKDRLLEVAQWQTEISRIADLGIEGAQEEEMQTRAQAIFDNMAESLSATQGLLEARNSSLEDEETLQTKENLDIDEQLSQAAEFNNFDKTFDEIINTNMLEYQRALLAAENGGNAEEKEVLQAAYDEANAILGLVEQS